MSQEKEIDYSKAGAKMIIAVGEVGLWAAASPWFPPALIGTVICSAEAIRQAIIYTSKPASPQNKP